MDSTKKLNFFPPKGGVSSYFSPRMIIHKESIDYNKHCQIPFGSYIQAHEENEPSNSMKPRALDGIYLRYISNDHGGHEILNLATGEIIRRRKITMIPITQHVIKSVQTLAEKDQMPEGMKVTHKTGVQLLDSAWMPGVHYEEQKKENESDTSDTEDETQDGIDENEVYEILQNNEKHISDDKQDQFEVISEYYEDEIMDNSSESNYQEQEIQNQAEEQNIIEDENVNKTRSGRPINRLNLFQQELDSLNEKNLEYGLESAKVMARIINKFNDNGYDKQDKSFMQAFTLKQGINKFGNKGIQAATDELKQLHER